MGIRFYKEPELKDPVLVAAWPGIGNIGIIAVDNLRSQLEAELFADIEPMEFFYPKRVFIRHGELKEMEFPESQFYYRKMEGHDLILFIGEEQPAEPGKAYAEGELAYRMANLVMDVADKYGCRRIYTSGAAVTSIHHQSESRTWVVPNQPYLVQEVKSYLNALLMSENGGRGGRGLITGLNGLLLGVAGKRGVEAVCLMGEVPVYMQTVAVPYPRGARAVIKTLCSALAMPYEYSEIDRFVGEVDLELERLYQALPQEIKDSVDRFRPETPANSGPITEEDKKKIMEDIDKLFGKKQEGDHK